MAATASPFIELSSSLAAIAAAIAPSIVEVQSHRLLASGFVGATGW